MTNTIDYAGMQWEILTHSWTPYAKAYCADGDGLVRVCERVRGCFSGFLVFDQRELVGKHDTLQSALDQASSVLKEEYPAVFDSFYFGDDDSEVLQ